MTQQSRRPPPRDPKVEALRVDGTLHRRAHQIRDPLFGTHDFFDARDVVQVRYDVCARSCLELNSASAVIAKYLSIRPSLHLAWLRYSSVTDSRFAPSSRLARRAHRRPRCTRDFTITALAHWYRPSFTRSFANSETPWPRRRLGAREQKKRIRDIPGYTEICRDIVGCAPGVSAQ